MAQSATNYAEKYSDQLAQAYLQSSIIAGKTNTEYTFDGNKTVHVYSAVTQPLQDYKRSGTWRYGQPKELEDDVQDLTLKLDKSFSMTIKESGNSHQATDWRTSNTILRQARFTDMGYCC